MIDRTNNHPYSDRRAPFSDEFEQAVLSAMLLDEPAVRTATQLLEPAAFYREGHRRIYRAIVSLTERGAAVDPLTLSAELDRAGELQAAGGKDYIAVLMDAVPTSANVAFHAKHVRELFDRRRIIETASRITAEAFTGEMTAREIAVTAGEKLLPIATTASEGAGFRPIKDGIWALMEEIEARGQRAVAGLATGYTEIDRNTFGFRPKELVILAGIEKSGKTALALNIARHAAKSGVHVGFVSAEMDEKAIGERLLNAEAMVPSSRTATGRLWPDDYPRLAKAAGVIASLPLHIDDEPTPTLADVLARSIALKAKHPALALLFVDFLQIVTHRDGDRARHDEIEHICYQLKGLAKRLDVTVLATSQVNSKDSDELKDARPRLKDLAGSSGMRRAGDFVGLVYRPVMHDPMADDTMEVNFAACRRTPPFTARLIWDGAHMRVTERRLEVA